MKSLLVICSALFLLVVASPLAIAEDKQPPERQYRDVVALMIHDVYDDTGRGRYTLVKLDQRSKEVTFVTFDISDGSLRLFMDVPSDSSGWAVTHRGFISTRLEVHLHSVNNLLGGGWQRQTSIWTNRRGTTSVIR